MCYKMSIVQFSSNKTDRIYLSVGYFICRNIIKLQDDGFEIVQVPKDFKMRSIHQHRFVSDHPCIYYTLGIFEGEVIFKYNGIEFSLSISEKPNKLAHGMDESAIMVMYDIKSIGDIQEFILESSKKFSSFIDNMGAEAGEITIYAVDAPMWEFMDHKKCRNMDTVYLPEETKTDVIKSIDKFYASKPLYNSLNITHKMVMLFEGVAGSGKTSFITALASKFGYNLCIMYFNSKIDDTILAVIIRNMPKKSWLLIEDMDYLFQDRKTHDASKNMVTLSGILNVLDGASTKDGFVCFMTTNLKKNLDETLIRPGRVDKIVNFDYATKDQVHQIYKAFNIENYTLEKYTKFQTAIDKLKIKYTTSLLQQYLLKYIDEPDEALINIECMKKIGDSAIIDNGGEGMYN